MAVQSYYGSTPLDFLKEDEEEGQAALENVAKGELTKLVTDWKSKLHNARRSKVTIWNECWELYRGKENHSNKEEWHSKIVLPKAFNSVKQATSTIKRFLSVSKDPFSISSLDPDNIKWAIRGDQLSQLVRMFLENASYEEEFAIGLESGFIMGLGVWKVWWEMAERERYEVDTKQLQDGNIQKDLVRKLVSEGQLGVKAVDPYNFYWLPGSKLNKWTGTLEVVRVPKWELRNMIRKGAFNIATEETLDRIIGRTVKEVEEQANTRFNEFGTDSARTPEKETDAVELIEYFGPIVQDDEVVEPYGHIIVADDTEILTYGKNKAWQKRPPYVAFSPLNLPFRTEGMGLIEMVREIDKGLNKIANLSVDTLVFRLLPIFEVYPDLFENEEDLQTGIVPGKFFRRSLNDMSGVPGIKPIPFEDISAGTVQVASMLDRAHQEGALVSEIQQSQPRWRGVQTATETDLKNTQQETFFGAMATDIEKNALQPIVEMSMDFLCQYLDTAKDPRVPAVLGMNGQTLAAMNPVELLELVNGNYIVKVTGISSQIEKANMLQSVVQFMNIIGQNPEVWMPYVRQDVLLRKVLDAFRPQIPDVDDIVETAEVAAEKMKAMGAQRVTPDMLKALPGIMQAEAAKQAQQAQMQMQQQQMEQAQQMGIQKFQTDQQYTGAQIAEIIAKIDKIYAEIEMMKEPTPPKE